MPSQAAINRGLNLLEETLGRGRTLSPAARAAYVRVLSRLDERTWKRTVEAALETCTFLPAPAELLELARGNAGDAARAAWDVVEKAMSRLGAWESVDFGEPINAAVRHVGGWAELCATDLEVLVHRRREFETAVLGYLRNGVTDGRGDHLAGEFERAAIAKGCDDFVVHQLGPAADRARMLERGAA